VAASHDTTEEEPGTCQVLVPVFALLGKRWTGLILSTLMSGPARFSELARSIEGLSERMLGERLNELGEAGLVERVVHEHGRPRRRAQHARRGDLLAQQGVHEGRLASSGRPPDHDEQRRLDEVWEVLEVFPAFGDPLSPEQVVEVATEVLGRQPDLAGYADHARMGDLFKGRRGDFSVAEALEDQLAPVRGDG
jgi:DNA-binding HxlR family transcriptional regulator